MTWVMRGSKEKSRQGWELGAGGLRPVGIKDNFPKDRAFQQSPEGWQDLGITHGGGL